MGKRHEWAFQEEEVNVAPQTYEEMVNIFNKEEHANQDLN